MSDGTEDWCKIKSKSDFCFQIWPEELGKYA